MPTQASSLFHRKVQVAVAAQYRLTDYTNVRGVAANANSCQIGTHVVFNKIIELSVYIGRSPESKGLRMRYKTIVLMFVVSFG